MFKKFIITVATICTAATLTACGAGDKSSPNTLNKDNNADTNVDSTLSSEYQESTASSSTEEKMIGITDIRDVYEDNNEFLVTGTDDITYLINEDGHVLAQTSRCIGYANGYFYEYDYLYNTEWSIHKNYPYSNEQDAKIYTIYNKSGDLLFDESSKILTPISKSGYMMTFDIVDELSGKSEICQIVDVNGNLVFVFGKGWFNSVGYISDDIFYYEEDNEKKYYIV